MPNYERPDNENLFELPLGNIESILRDANNILIQDSNQMIESLLTIDLEINNINNIKDLVKNAKQIKSNLRNYRLKDGKPYKTGKDKVDNFYKQYESRIDDGLLRINDFLNQLANNEAENNTLNTEENIINQNQVENPEIIINQNFDLKWDIESFNKNILDYNVLKPYLSDYHVKLALNAHLKANGPNLIDGVIYKKKVK